MIIIWLQGIWLPLHGFSFEDTPLWAGIYMLPLTIGFMIMGPISGYLSDRFGARTFSTAGMIVTALGFGGLLLVPTNFVYIAFAMAILVIGMGMGMFASPNTTAIMNSVPPEHRGASSGMRADLPEFCQHNQHYLDLYHGHPRAGGSSAGCLVLGSDQGWRPGCGCPPGGHSASHGCPVRGLFSATTP